MPPPSEGTYRKYPGGRRTNNAAVSRDSLPGSNPIPVDIAARPAPLLGLLRHSACRAGLLRDGLRHDRLLLIAPCLMGRPLPGRATPPAATGSKPRHQNRENVAARNSSTMEHIRNLPQFPGSPVRLYVASVLRALTAEGVAVVESWCCCEEPSKSPAWRASINGLATPCPR
jgi:hypothetical protein